MCVCTGCSRSNSWVTRYEREKKKRIFYSFVFWEMKLRTKRFALSFFLLFLECFKRTNQKRGKKKFLLLFRNIVYSKTTKTNFFFELRSYCQESQKRKKEKKKLKELKKLKKKKIKKVETLFSFPELFPYLGRRKRIECTWNEWRVWRRKENDRETDGGQRRRGERRFRRVIGSAGVDAILSSIPHQPPPGNLYLLSLHPLPPPS